MLAHSEWWAANPHAVTWQSAVAELAYHSGLLQPLAKGYQGKGDGGEEF